MVNGKWTAFYIALLSKALYNEGLTFTHPHTHSYTNGGSHHARCQPSHWEQFGVKYLAQ